MTQQNRPVTIQTRFYDSRDGDRTTPWRTALEVPSALEGRMQIIRLLQDLGFGPFSEIILLADDLDPGKYTEPAIESRLTADNGNEVRAIYTQP